VPKLSFFDIRHNGRQISLELRRIGVRSAAY
jgi:hypothetical protein